MTSHLDSVLNPQRLLPIFFALACLIAYPLPYNIVIWFILTGLIISTACVATALPKNKPPRTNILLLKIARYILIFFFVVGVLKYIQLVVPPIAEKFSLRGLHTQITYDENSFFGKFMAVYVFCVAGKLYLISDMIRDNIYPKNIENINSSGAEWIELIDMKTDSTESETDSEIAYTAMLTSTKLYLRGIEPGPTDVEANKSGTEELIEPHRDELGKIKIQNPVPTRATESPEEPLIKKRKIEETLTKVLEALKQLKTQELRTEIADLGTDKPGAKEEMTEQSEAEDPFIEQLGAAPLGAKESMAEQSGFEILDTDALGTAEQGAEKSSSFFEV